MTGSDGQQQERETVTVHLAPADGSGRTRCCSRTPFELPDTDRITSDSHRSTCPCGEPFADQAGWMHVCTAPVAVTHQHRCDTCAERASWHKWPDVAKCLAALQCPVYVITGGDR